MAIGTPCCRSPSSRKKDGQLRFYSPWCHQRNTVVCSFVLWLRTFIVGFFGKCRHHHPPCLVATSRNKCAMLQHVLIATMMWYGTTRAWLNDGMKNPPAVRQIKYFQFVFDLPYQILFVRMFCSTHVEHEDTSYFVAITVIGNTYWDTCVKLCFRSERLIVEPRGPSEP